MQMELRHFLDHIKEVHSYLPGFSIVCGMYGCPRSYTKFVTFRTHVYAAHGGDPGITNQPIPSVRQQPECSPRDLPESDQGM